MSTVRVEIRPRPYEVRIEHGLLKDSGAAIAQWRGGRKGRVFVVTVAPVRKLWGGKLRESLTRAGLDAHFLEIGDGERSKTLGTVQRLAGSMVRGGADRHAALLAFGGGVVGDVTGLLASVYMRGIDLVQFPTTLLAQLDAAVGGKNGVNLAAGKNLIGTIHQPLGVLIDPELLKTLPEREYRAGLYEALKCGVIRDPAIFAFMEKKREAILARDREALEWLITACVRVKAEVVAADEREEGLRRILNFGHTLGHALEAETAYKTFLHGEAVGWGMVGAALIAAALRRTETTVTQRIGSAVMAYGPLPRVTVRSRAVARRMRSDKKTLGGKIHFILPRKIGEVEVADDVPESAVLEAIEDLRYLSQR
jgi:3-dehydroquinate synthase